MKHTKKNREGCLTKLLTETEKQKQYQNYCKPLRGRRRSELWIGGRTACSRVTAVRARDLAGLGQKEATAEVGSDSNIERLASANRTHNSSALWKKLHNIWRLESLNHTW
ncbi:hypothetical protein NL676_001852 [Syzygium grande]|nr:hypothetical protein NL676_001852 [Syzygium grande]